MKRPGQRILTPLFSFLTYAILLAMPQRSLANAMLQKSTPAPNAVVSLAADGRMPVRLTFNSRVDAAHSTLALTSAAGGKPIALAIDPKAEPNVLSSIASALKPGHYILKWQAVASDGHISRGVVPFDVR